MDARNRDDTVVELRGVSKSFPTTADDTLTVLDDVSLTVRTGEFVVIVGPSGCGKTTLLRMVQGLDVPTGGEVGVAVTEGPSADLSFVFQRPSLLPWRTVQRNVEFGLELAASRGLFAGKAQRDAYVTELLAMVGLGEFRSYLPHRISGGMQQRTNLARALAVKPTLLLMDEPFSALDALTKEHLQWEVQNVVTTLGTSVMFVTHDIREAVFLADRIVVMSARPSRIVKVLDIDEERPRPLEFQQSDKLASYAREVWNLLQTPDSLHAEEHAHVGD